MLVTRLLLALVLLAGILYGCHGQGGVTPTPEETPTLSLPEADAFLPRGTASLGGWQLVLDPAGGQVSLAPLTRTTQGVGDTYAVDATDFFNFAPCDSCFEVDGFGINGVGQLYVDYRIRHPYQLPDSGAPKPADRLDLHIFDVQGVFMFANGQSEGQSTFAALNSLGVGNGGPQALTIDNSGFLAGITLDGYTGAYDDYTDSFYPTLTSIHPFAMLHNDTGETNFSAGHPNGFTDLQAPTGHNVLPMGGGPYLKRIYFNATGSSSPIEAVVMLFAHVGIASEGRGTELGQRMNPAYFLPEFNMKEPWRVQVHEIANSLEEGLPASTATLEVEIFDWQHAASPSQVVGTLSADPGLPRDALTQSSKVVAIRGQVASVANPSDIQATYGGGDGSQANPLRWQVVIPNALSAAEGTHMGLLEIVDDYDLDLTVPGGLGRDGRTKYGLGRASTFWPFSVAVHPPSAGGGSTGFGESSSLFDGNNGPSNVPGSITYPVDAYDNFAASTQGVPRIFATFQASGRQDLSGEDIVHVQSSNGGTNWSSVAQVNHGSLLFEGDQKDPAIALGAGPQVYVIYTGPPSLNLFQTENIYVQTSLDYGGTWSTRRLLYSKTGKKQTKPTLTVTPSGRVVAAWVRDEGNRIGLAYSDDFGATWPSNWNYETPKTVHGLQVLAAPQSKAANGFTVVYSQQRSGAAEINTLHYPYGTTQLWAQLAASHEDSSLQSRSSRGRYSEASGDLLVAYVTLSDDDAALYVTRKTWGGTSFEAPVKIATVEGGGIEHPSLLLRANGEAILAWNDDSDPLTGHDIYVARSANSGVAWTEPVRVDGRPGHQRWPQLFLDANSQSGYMAWWDDTRGNSPKGLQFAVEVLD